jgi:putative endonuclease
MNPRLRGKWGEGVAVEYLKNKGYTIVKTGFRSRFGEIDIIAKSKEYLTIIEVKTRKNSNFAHAKEYVSKDKQRKIISTANYWLIKRPTKLQPRFDVIEIYAKDGEQTTEPEIIHIENAFGV